MIQQLILSVRRSIVPLAADPNTATRFTLGLLTKLIQRWNYLLVQLVSERVFPLVLLITCLTSSNFLVFKIFLACHSKTVLGNLWIVVRPVILVYLLVRVFCFPNHAATLRH